MINPHTKYHPIAPEGFVIIGIFALLSIVGGYFFWPVGLVFLL